MTEGPPPGNPDWPEEDIPPADGDAAPVSDAPTPETDEARSAFEAWDPRRHLDRRRPTTAEQAVPWLIGIILAQTGMLIVLLALIFTGTGGVANASPTPSLPTVSSAPSASQDPSAQPSPSAEPSVAEPTATPGPSFGPLEIVYLGRPSAAAPIDLLRRDFSITGEPTVVKRDSTGVDRMIWSGDGSVGVALISGNLLVLIEGEAERELATGITAVTFGQDSSTLYAIRTARNGANDTTSVLEIDVASGGTTTVASVTYLHPEIVNDPPLREAQYADNGGVARIWYTTTDALVIYLLGAPSLYRVDPDDGTVTDAERQPVLASPDRRWEIRVVEASTRSSTLELYNRITDAVEASVAVSGLVSHVRWATASNEIVFTLGFLSSGGGVRQDLYVWDLQDGNAAAALTANGASFGAEWLGSPQAWYE